MVQARLLLAAALLLASCAGGGTPPGPSSPASFATTTATTAATTSSVPPGLLDCPPIPYVVGALPARVAGEVPPGGSAPLEEYSSLPGTRSLLWLDDRGAVAVALVRGTLPLTEFPGEKGQVEVAGLPAVAGPFDDGSWVVAWFEEPGERCDLYTMVFYPPVEPAEVEATVSSITRPGG